MTARETEFRERIRTLIRAGIPPTPKNVSGVRNLNGRETRWRREEMESFGFMKNPVTGRWIPSRRRKLVFPPDGIVVGDLWTSRTYVTGCGEVLHNVHRMSDCAEQGRCVIHAPSAHPMRLFPTHWREAGPFDIKPSHMERICPHGIGHPDPDSHIAADVAVHGCDGCCR